MTDVGPGSPLAAATPESFPASDAGPGTALSVIHPSFQPSLEWRQSGQLFRAQLGFDKLASALAQPAAEPNFEQEALWLEATRLWFETTLESGQGEFALRDLRRRFERFNDSSWTGLKQSTARFYHDMIRLSIATGLDEQAFDLYQQARETVAVPPELRIKLLEIAHRLDRFDPATARLCIEELTTSPQTDEAQTARLFEILRRAIRVTPEHPSLELLAEFRALNLQTWETARQGWAVGHLAMADWRLGQFADADRWCQLRRPRHQQDPAETDLLLGAVSYLRHDWKRARDLFHQARGKDAPELHPIITTLSQLEELNDRLERRGTGQSEEEFQQSIHQALVSFQGCERHDGWRLDADWVIASALAVLGQTQFALSRFREAPMALARWRHASAGWMLLQAQLQPKEIDEWAGRLAVAQPAVADCLHVLRDVTALQFETAGTALAGASSVHATVLHNDAELRNTVACLTAELALAKAEATPACEEAVWPAFQEWRDRLIVRRLIERGDIQSAEKLAAKTTQHTAPPPQRERLQTVFAATDHQPPEQIDALFERLTNHPAAEPLDRLHAGLWLSYRQRHTDAEPHLMAFAALFPGCVECQLGLMEIDLHHGRVEAVRERLSQLAPLTVWRNQFRWAWFRPWQQLISPEVPIDRALVASPRLADALHATDLALKAGDTEWAVATLGHFQTLLGPHVPEFATELGTRFNQAAAIEAERGNWEQACRHHQSALAHGNRDAQFVEAVAATYATATTAPDDVLEVFVTWLTEFPDSEAQFLESSPGRVFANLVRIESLTEPDSEREFTHRRRWTERFHQLRPDWDEPKHSLLRVQMRLADDAQVIAIADTIREKRVGDQQLLARALWNSGRFEEAAAAFTAGEEPGWAGIVAVAVRFQRVGEDGLWLSPETAEPLLARLTASHDELAHLPEWRLWMGATLVAARRGAEAVAHLEPAVENDGNLDAHRRILLGLAWLLAEETERTEALWAPPLPLDALLAAPELLINWNRQEALLWMLVRLQRHGDHELPLLGKLAQEWRKLGETSATFQTVVAALALRLGDMAAANDAARAMSASEVRPTRAILQAPVQCFLHDERAFIRSRMLMQSGQFAEAERGFSTEFSGAIGGTRGDYWIAMCRLHQGDTAAADKRLAELQERCPTDPAVPAQRAQWRVVTGDLEVAQTLCQSALAIDPTHAFALFVHAEIAERRGELDSVEATFRQILTLPVWQVHRRLRAAVTMALGRLMLADGDARLALKHFRLARKASPHDAWVAQRMGITLAACAESAEEFQEAEQLLSVATNSDQHDLIAAIARVITADHLNNTTLVSERLEVVVRHPDFTQLPPAIRREWVVFSVETQLRQQRYRAAAEALERLLQESPDEEIAERLRRCRLLEALQVLGQHPLPAEAFEQIRNAAATVCAGPQPPPVAVVLQVMGQLFTGQCDTAEARAAALAALRDATHHGMEWLTQIVRYWLGDESAAKELEALWEQPETSALKRVVETISANQQKKAARLSEEARRLIAAEKIDPTAAFDPEDLVVVAALTDGVSNVEQAESLLTQWHARKRGSARTRLLLSKLLAKHAVKTLKQKKFGETRQLLRDALVAAEN